MIEIVLADTDVLSYLYKKDSRATVYQPYLDGKLMALSFMTIAELELWTLLRGWSERRRRELEVFLKDFVVVDSDRELCRTWGNVRAQGKRKGRPIDTADAWIAATALTFDVPLITHNRADFQYVEGLRIISES